MYMKMKHRLPSARAVINYRPITPISKSLRVCHSRGNPKQVAQQRLVFLRSIVQRFNVFVRNHQQVSRRLRINIANNDRRVVLVDEVGWNLLRYYSTKQATLF